MNDLSASLSGLYCERLGPGFWAEPANAISNVAFLIAALVVLARRRDDPPLMALAVVTFVIGIGSFLFHTFATRWALLADVIPIQIFIGLYFFLALRRFWGLGFIVAALATMAFVAAASQIPQLLPFGPWRGLGGYLGGLLGLVGVGASLLVRSGEPLSRSTGYGLLGVALLFALSLVFRTADGAVCAYLPTGLHPFWHMTNALVLYALMTIFERARAPRAS